MKQNIAMSGACLVLLWACVWMMGCNASDAEVVDDRRAVAGGKETKVVVEQPSTSVRDAHVQEFQTVRTIPEEIFTEMVEQEEKLEEHGVRGSARDAKSYRPIYVRGHYSAAYVEPQTNKIAWRGMTCTHDDCTGQGHEGGAFVFADVYPELRVDASGELVGEIPPKDVVCPACNRHDRIERYSPPEAVLRRSELLAQLAEIRAARDAARKNGQPMPELTISPRAIQDELANLPLLYLLEE